MLRSLLVLAFIGVAAAGLTTTMEEDKGLSMEKRADTADAPCESKGGTCQDDSLYCHGAYETGLCGGDVSRRCCLPPIDALCEDYGGRCIAYHEYCDVDEMVSTYKTCDGYHEICCIHKHGYARKDPHMKTFDGRPYSFQGKCWYTLIMDCSGPKPAFEIIAKFAPNDDGTKTRTVAINVAVGNEYVSTEGFDVTRGTKDGQHYTSNSITVQDGGDKIKRLSFTVKSTTFSVTWNPIQHIFSADVSGNDYNGKLCGLLGNNDGLPLNDFQKRDGIVVHDVDEFGESWKVEEIKCDF